MIIALKKFKNVAAQEDLLFLAGLDDVIKALEAQRGSPVGCQDLVELIQDSKVVGVGVDELIRTGQYSLEAGSNFLIDRR